MSWIQEFAHRDARETGAPDEAAGATATPQAAGAHREQAPLWHGTAFLIEALVLLAFLMGALAVFAHLFADARSEAARGVELSEAVALAQNAAERLAAEDDPAALAGTRTVKGGQTGETYEIDLALEPEQRDGGTLWRASITVRRDAGEHAGSPDDDADDADGTGSAEATTGQQEGRVVYTLATARYVSESEVA